KVRGIAVDLECKRDNRIFVTQIHPVKDATDSKYRLGIWVRDSTAGVGTLTFVDPVTKHMGALGHAITDVDTGS
ncbi:MAG TPA: SpoIVB peptidase, partial [Clostridiales bacterium]|nr:SpoIVB peptidase [Clostridiales bacterium]